MDMTECESPVFIAARRECEGVALVLGNPEALSGHSTPALRARGKVATSGHLSLGPTGHRAVKPRPSCVRADEAAVPCERRDERGASGRPRDRRGTSGRPRDG